jgi:hypothetical protein
MVNDSFHASPGNSKGTSMNKISATAFLAFALVTAPALAADAASDASAAASALSADGSAMVVDGSLLAAAGSGIRGEECRGQRRRTGVRG